MCIPRCAAGVLKPLVTARHPTFGEDLRSQCELVLRAMGLAAHQAALAATLLRAAAAHAAVDAAAASASLPVYHVRCVCLPNIVCDPP